MAPDNNGSAFTATWGIEIEHMHVASNISSNWKHLTFDKSISLAKNYEATKTNINSNNDAENVS